ncbi:MAG: hypothetical protein RSA10_00250, partial [Bacilli bacterium]
QSNIDVINAEYGYLANAVLTKKSNIFIGDKNFEYFIGSYEKKENGISYKVDERILIYELEKEGRLIIKINAYDNKVTDEMLNELTKFSYENKKYK